MQPFEIDSVDEREFLEEWDDTPTPTPKSQILKIVLIISFIIVRLARVGVILFLF